MKIIDNVYEGKSAYILGNLIVCGCQTISIDELDEVAKKYGVTDFKVSEIISLFDLETNWDEAIAYEDWRVRRAVAKQGFGLETLINDVEWIVRKEAKRQLNN